MRHWIADLRATSDLLSLAGKRAPIVVLKTWSQQQVLAAEKWAIAVHLRASDNPSVRVPKCPPHVQSLGDCA